jgi:hypothetical protein
MEFRIELLNCIYTTSGIVYMFDKHKTEKMFCTFTKVKQINYINEGFVEPIRGNFKGKRKKRTNNVPFHQEFKLKLDFNQSLLFCIAFMYALPTISKFNVLHIPVGGKNFILLPKMNMIKP